MRIVKTKSSLHAQAMVVGGAVTAFDPHDSLAFDLIGEQATHTAKWAHRIHLAVNRLVAHQGLGQQGPSGTSLHAFTASHT